MTDAEYEAQVAEVERKREAVREFFRLSISHAVPVWRIAEVFPLPERPRKLREVQDSDGTTYRYTDKGYEYLAVSGTWKLPTAHSLSRLAKHIRVASLRDNPYEDQAP